MKKIAIFLIVVILLSTLMVPMTPIYAETSGSYTYTISNNKATITKCDPSISGEVVIPSELGGCPVTKVDESAFYSCRSITSLVIPDSVFSIAKTAFGSCTSLKKVTISSNVTTIMLNAFTGCNALKEVHISSLEAWLNIDFGGHYSNPAYISKALYLNGELVTDVIVPYGVTYITGYAFSGYTPLKSVSIPVSVTQIDKSAFYKCINLEEITLSNRLNSIGGSAFFGCTSIKEITLPRSLKTVYDNAFADCTALTDVYYTGLDTEYANIAIKSNNDPLVNATYHHIHTVQGSWKIEKNATCESAGLMYKDCTVCDGREEQIIPKTEHKYQSSNIDSTCTNAGYTEFLCSECGHNYKDNYISAKGHNFTCSVVEATCTSNGYTVYACECGESYQADFISAIGHNYVAKVVEPTCTESGYTVYDCSNCDDSYIANHTSLSGHSFSEEVVVPTCITNGYTIYTCECGESYQADFTSVAPHNYVTNVVEPTCSELGYTEYTCANCGDYYKDDYVSELGHIYGNWEEVTIVSCDKEGKWARTCWCGYEEVKTLDKLPHTYETVIVEPSPEGQGYSEHTCIVCGDSYKDNFVDYDSVSRLILSSANAVAGHKFKVDLIAINNPGVMSAKVLVKFDSSVFTLLSITDSGVWGTQMHSDVLGSPYTLCWVNDTVSENYVNNGVIATLEFIVNSDAEMGDYNIEVYYDYDNYDIINTDLEKVDFTIELATITVKQVLYGDVNSDGIVNNLDRVILTRYLANWEGYTADVLDMYAADVNCDGVVNALDRVILTRHLADWDDYSTLPYGA